LHLASNGIPNIGQQAIYHQTRYSKHSARRFINIKIIALKKPCR